MDDVVLSVVKNRFWLDVDVCALSLVQSGYQGRMVMFVEDVPNLAVDNLKALRFEVYPFITPPEYQHLHFQSYRYYIARHFIHDCLEDLRYVIWTDVCDLAFQSDPTVHLSTHQITAAKEGRKMNAGHGKGWNEIWVRQFLPKQEADKLMDEEVLCSGSIAGDAAEMAAMIDNIWHWSKRYGELRGIDQGIYNYLARDPDFKESIRIPEMSEGFVSTCGMFMSEYNNDEWTVPPPYLDRQTGLVLNELGKPFSMVHCYDRTGGYLNPIGDFRAILERRYRK